MGALMETDSLAVLNFMLTTRQAAWNPFGDSTDDSAEKPLGMLRRAHTSTSSVERKILNVNKPLPVRPEALEG